MQLPNRKKIEKDFHDRMELLSKRHRRELRQLMGTPVDPSLVPEEFWRRVEREAESETAAILLLLFGVGARTAARSVGGDYKENETAILSQADTYGTQRSRKVGADYARGARDSFARRSAEWTKQTPEPKPPTRAEIDQGLDRVFHEPLTKRIVVDETTAAQFNGGEAGVRETVGISQNDRWRTRPLWSCSHPNQW